MTEPIFSNDTVERELAELRERLTRSFSVLDGLGELQSETGRLRANADEALKLLAEADDKLAALKVNHEEVLTGLRAQSAQAFTQLSEQQRLQREHFENAIQAHQTQAQQLITTLESATHDLAQAKAGALQAFEERQRELNTEWETRQGQLIAEWEAYRQRLTREWDERQQALERRIEGALHDVRENSRLAQEIHSHKLQAVKILGVAAVLLSIVALSMTSFVLLTRH